MKLIDNIKQSARTKKVGLSHELHRKVDVMVCVDVRKQVLYQGLNVMLLKMNTDIYG